MLSQQDTFPTLKSLSGLRLGFHHTESIFNDATDCFGLNDTVHFCENATNSTVRLKV